MISKPKPYPICVCGLRFDHHYYLSRVRPSVCPGNSLRDYVPKEQDDDQPTK